jgi:hypothetical protein
MPATKGNFFFQNKLQEHTSFSLVHSTMASLIEAPLGIDITSADDFAIGCRSFRTCSVLEIKQCMHECQNCDLFDLDTKLMTSLGLVYKQQARSSRYCVANDNLCNVRCYCKLLILQHSAFRTQRCYLLIDDYCVMYVHAWYISCYSASYDKWSRVSGYKVGRTL